MTENALNQGLIWADWPVPAHVKACVTTRQGGVSQTPYDSLNLGAHVNDDPANVEENRRRLASALGLAFESFTWLRQIHGIEVLNLDSGDQIDPSPCADAVTSTQKNAVCLVMTADCLPVLLCDEQGTRIAALHAGWRGLCDGVIETTLACFDNPSKVMAWLGPAIGPKAFEVGAEVRDAFIKVDPNAQDAFVEAADGKWLGDLYLLACQRLKKAGVQGIYGGGLCTFTDSDRFYSFRRDGACSGRMASLIYLT